MCEEGVVEMYKIETERLLLRKLGNSDLEILIEMLGNPNVMKWLFSGRPMEYAEAESFIKENFSFGSAIIGLGTLCEKSTGRVIGFAGLIPCNYFDAEEIEFGCALREDFWGMGYATEICEAQIKYGFDALDINRLLALAHPENRASLRVLERIGMTFLTEINTESRGPRRVYVIERKKYLTSIRPKIR